MNGAAAPAGLQTADRVLRTLELFSTVGPEIAVAEVARELGIDRSIASRLLTTLEARQYVTQDSATGRFRLGVRILELGELYLQHDPVVAAAMPHLQALATQTGGTANLFVLLGGQAVRLAAYPARPMTGIRVPAHCTAAGKVLLAALSSAALDAVVTQHGLPANTPRSITSRAALEACLVEVRERGYATDLEERNLGRACLAAPVRDVTGRTVAAVSANWLASALTAERLPALVDAVREAALAVSEGLGRKAIPHLETQQRSHAA
jgi:DNA-binding IclR family transcriptional regulator